MIYTPYLWPKFLAVLIPLGFAWYARRFRDVPAALPFSRMMGVTAAWALFHALNSVTVSLPLRLWWGHLQIIPTVGLAPATFAFAMAYTGQEKRLTRRHWAWLLLIPLATVLLEWTGAYHTLYRYNFSLDVSGATPTLHDAKGLWYWMHTGYMYLLLLLASGRLVTAFPPLTPYFWNALVIAFCVIFLFAISLLYDRGITPIPGYNFSSTTFIFTGALQLWAMLRFRLFDLIPIARETMLEQMQEGMIVVDAQQRIVDINAAAAAILGASRAHLIGRAFTSVAGLSGLSAFSPDPATAQIEQPVELEIARRWYQVSSAPLRDPRGLRPGRLIILHDITDLKQAQARVLEQQRALAMTDERARLARELHDGLGQVLGYVKMRVQVARELLAEGQQGEVDAYLANLIAVAQDAHTDIREYLLGVRATGAADAAFVSALQQYVRQFSRNYGIRTELTVAPEVSDGALTPTTEVQLLRIIQEALTNVRKYAQATRIQINLAAQNDTVTVIIQDDGQGFDPTQPPASGPTFGLRFMRERAEELRGSLDVQSAPGKGTCINVTIPQRNHES